MPSFEPKPPPTYRAMIFTFAGSMRSVEAIRTWAYSVTWVLT
jgi:hypothetical protein